jgi:uncharacterized protein YukE
MPEQFRVDIEALASAAIGVGDAVTAAGEQRVEDLDVDEAAFGHGALGSTSQDFCDRWQRGVDNLLKDGQELARRLGESATTYLDTEQRNTDGFTAAVGGS